MNHYECLKVSQGASVEEIRKAYRRAAAKHHPDRGGQTSEFHKVQLAWEVLGNTATRAQYDHELWQASQPKPKPQQARPTTPPAGQRQQSSTQTTGEPQNFDTIFDDFLRQHGPRQDPPAADPAEEKLRQEFIAKYNRAPGQRPSWYRKSPDFGDAPPMGTAEFNTWARESNEYWEWHHEQSDRMATEDAVYAEQVNFLHMTDHERAAHERTKQAEQSQQQAEETATDAKTKREAPYWAARNKLPYRFQERAAGQQTNGIPLRSLRVWLALDRATIIIPILGAIGILIVSEVATGAHPVVAIFAGAVEIVLLAPAVWIAWMILNGIVSLAFKSAPARITLEQDIKNFVNHSARFTQPAPQATPTPKASSKPTKTKSSPTPSQSTPTAKPAYQPRRPGTTAPSAAKTYPSYPTSSSPRQPVPPQPKWKSNTRIYWDARSKLPTDLSAYAPGMGSKGLPLASLKKWDIAETSLAVALILATLGTAVIIFATTNFDSNPDLIRLIITVPCSVVIAIGVRILTHRALRSYLRRQPAIVPLALDEENYITHQLGKQSSTK